MTKKYTAIQPDSITAPNGGVTTRIYTAKDDGMLFLISQQAWTKNYSVNLISENGITSCVGYCYDDYNGNTRRNTFVIPMRKSEHVEIWNSGGSAIGFPNGASFIPYKIEQSPYNYFIKF